MNGHDPTDDELQSLLDRLSSEGRVGDDALAGFVAGMQSAYAQDTPPPVGIGLSEFVDVDLIVDKGDLLATAASNASGPVTQVSVLPKRRDARTRTSTHRRSKVISSISAFVGTVAGKIVVGTTVAVAATGGLQATGVVDVPILPDLHSDEIVEVVETDPVEDLDLDFDADESDEVDEAGEAGEELAFAADDEDDMDDMDDMDDEGVEVDEAELDDIDDDDDAMERCSEQADAIEDAAEGKGDEAEELAEAEADKLEAACEEALAGSFRIDFDHDDDEDDEDDDHDGDRDSDGTVRHEDHEDDDHDDDGEHDERDDDERDHDEYESEDDEDEYDEDDEDDEDDEHEDHEEEDEVEHDD